MLQPKRTKFRKAQKGRIKGAAKGGDGWFEPTHAVGSYDHPHHALLEEAITIDFVNQALGPGARAAVELTLESAKALSGALSRAIAAAEIEEKARSGPMQEPTRV